MGHLVSQSARHRARLCVLGLTTWGDPAQNTVPEMISITIFINANATITLWWGCQELSKLFSPKFSRWPPGLKPVFKIEWICVPPGEIIVQWMKCGLLKIGLTCWGTLFTLNFSVRELKIAGHWVSSLISGKVSNVFRHVVFSQKKVIVIDLQHQDVFHNQIVHSKM